MSDGLDPVLRELLAAVPPPRTDAQRRRRAPRARRGGRDGGGRSTARRKCTFALRDDLVRSFRRLCAVHGVEQRKVVEELVEAYVAQHGHRLVSKETGA